MEEKRLLRVNGIHENLNEKKEPDLEAEIRNLKNEIEQIKRKPFVEYALKVLDELNLREENLEQLPSACKVAEYILKKTKSRLETSRKLENLAYEIYRLELYFALLIQSRKDHDDGEIKKIEQEIDLVQIDDVLKPEEIRGFPPYYSKGIRLIKFEKEIRGLSVFYFNSHPINETPDFHPDDDPKATRYNFFDIKRIEKSIDKISDDNKKLRYLLQMKDAYLNEDERGFIKRNGKLVFKADKRFLRDLEVQITIYEKTVDIRKTSDELQNLTEDKKRKNLTLDRAILFMDFLFNYHKAEMNKTKRSDAINFISRFSKNTIRQRLSSIYTPENTQKTNYKKNLRIIRNYFDELGLTEISKMIDNELNRKN